MISISDIFKTTIPINIVKYQLKVQRVFLQHTSIFVKKSAKKGSRMATHGIRFLETNPIKFFYEGLCDWNDILGIWDLVRNKCRNWFVYLLFSYSKPTVQVCPCDFC